MCGSFIKSSSHALAKLSLGREEGKVDMQKCWTPGDGQEVGTKRGIVCCSDKKKMWGGGGGNIPLTSKHRSLDLSYIPYKYIHKMNFLLIEAFLSFFFCPLNDPWPEQLLLTFLESFLPLSMLARMQKAESSTAWITGPYPLAYAKPLSFYLFSPLPYPYS